MDLTHIVKGKGSFGCVISPYINIDNKQYHTNIPNIPKVSKVFKKIFLAKLEYDENMTYKDIIDPNGLSTVNIYDANNITEDSQKKFIVENCEFNDMAYDYFPQIIMEDGGIDLRIYLREFSRSSNPTKIPFDVFINTFKNLINVLSKLHENKIIHQDIKIENILINSSYDLKIIDFGITKKFEDVYNISNYNALIYTYPTFPPEYKFIGYIYSLIEKGTTLNEFLSLLENQNNIEYIRHNILRVNVMKYPDIVPKYIIDRMNKQGITIDYYKDQEDRFITTIKEIIKKSKDLESFFNEFKKIAQYVDVYSIGIVLIQFEQCIDLNEENLDFYRGMIDACISCDVNERPTMKNIVNNIGNYMSRMDMSGGLSTFNLDSKSKPYSKSKKKYFSIIKPANNKQNIKIKQNSIFKKIDGTIKPDDKIKIDSNKFISEQKTPLKKNTIFEKIIILNYLKSKSVKSKRFVKSKPAKTQPVKSKRVVKPRSSKPKTI
jgi:serine/threonine protein kinase